MQTISFTNPTEHVLCHNLGRSIISCVPGKSPKAILLCGIDVIPETVSLFLKHFSKNVCSALELNIA